LVLSCSVSEILQLLNAQTHFFSTPPLFGQKFWGVPFGVAPRCCVKMIKIYVCPISCSILLHCLYFKVVEGCSRSFAASPQADAQSICDS